MTDMINKAYVSMMCKKAVAKDRLNEFLHEERGAVDLIVIVVLIAIVMILVIVFKEQITGIINDLLDSISGNADKALEDAPASSAPPSSSGG